MKITNDFFYVCYTASTNFLSNFQFGTFSSKISLKSEKTESLLPSELETKKASKKTHVHSKLRKFKIKKELSNNTSSLSSSSSDVFKKPASSHDDISISYSAEQIGT
jgi:predicted Zn-dependent peptidase